MKNFILSLIIASSALATHQASATAGFVTANPMMIISGLVLTSMSGAPKAVLYRDYNGGYFYRNESRNTLFAFFGMFVLDGENGRQIQFSELESEQAEGLNISEDERLIFNSELDQANSLVSQVTKNVSSLEKPTAKDAANEWDKLADSVAPETLKTMKAIASQQTK
jgi:hypothetical protein